MVRDGGATVISNGPIRSETYDVVWESEFRASRHRSFICRRCIRADEESGE